MNNSIAILPDDALREIFRAANYVPALAWTCQAWRELYLTVNWPSAVVVHGGKELNSELVVSFLAESTLVTTLEETVTLLMILARKNMCCPHLVSPMENPGKDSVEFKKVPPEVWEAAYTKLLRRGTAVGLDGYWWMPCVWMATSRANVEAVRLLLVNGVFTFLRKEDCSVLFLSVVLQSNVDRGVECAEQMVRHLKDRPFDGSTLQCILMNKTWSAPSKSRLLTVLLAAPQLQLGYPLACVAKWAMEQSECPDLLGKVVDVFLRRQEDPDFPTMARFLLRECRAVFTAALPPVLQTLVSLVKR